MAWVNVGNIKGDTGDTGREGTGINVYRDSAHDEIIFVGDETMETIYLSELKGATGATGPKGDTGATGPVNLVSTLDRSDTVNAVTNSAIANEFESIETAIGNITSVQTANLNLLGS